MSKIFKSELANEYKKLGTLSVVYDDYGNELSAVVSDENNEVVHAQASGSNGRGHYTFGDGAHINLNASMINRDVVRFYIEEVAHIDYPGSEDRVVKYWREIVDSGCVEKLRIGIYPPYYPERLYEDYLAHYGVFTRVGKAKPSLEQEDA